MKRPTWFGLAGMLLFAVLLSSCGGGPNFVQQCPSGFQGVPGTNPEGFPLTSCVLNTDKQGTWSGLWSSASTGRHGMLVLNLSSQGNDTGAITFADTNQTVSLAMLKVSAGVLSDSLPANQLPGISFQYTDQGQVYLVVGSVVFSGDNHLRSASVNIELFSGTQSPNIPFSFDLAQP